MKTLFDSLIEVVHSDWIPQEPPCLDGIHDIYLNFETTGLQWFEKDRPIAASLYAGDKTYYLPWGHAGGNLDEETVKRWAQRELRGKRITNINTRFDIHMAREWGVDLEAQGNEVSDVAHYAALLDDHRFKMGLDALIPDYLGETPMVRIDESRMASYHASEAAPRSMYGIEAVKRLRDVMWPMLEMQDLQRVRALEDRVIYVVCEMEKNGAPIDLELLERWIAQSQEQLNGYLLQLAKDLGWQCNPDSPKDMERVFRQLHLSIEQTETGRPSFTDAILREISHPTIKLIRRAGKLASLRSKFLVNTQKNLDSHGILRYALHQLRAAKDEFADAGEAGTVTGRFSSSEVTPGFGVNIQQRMKAAKQRVAFGYGEKDTTHDDEIFLVRKLHIAQQGQVLSSDMDQAQYRIFASYANNSRVIEAYRENPNLSFHEFMHDLLNPFATLTYRQQKDLNFAYLFGAGLTKMGLMLGHISAAEFHEIRQTKNFDHPKLAQTKEVKRIYEREVPEVKELLERAAHLAKPKCDEKCNRSDALHRTSQHRGYVRTVVGRRSRFPEGKRLHKAFNSVDQGSEADVMKTKLVELHDARRETGFILRITNHDEVVGDIQDAEGARKVDAILNRQSFSQLRVPLTWSTGIGPNWAECSSLPSEFQGLEETRALLNYEGTTGHR
jgi:DNA polymerase I-like protein with 3'-5' exonuclease and polymerase domains